MEKARKRMCDRKFSYEISETAVVVAVCNQSFLRPKTIMHFLVKLQGIASCIFRLQRHYFSEIRVILSDGG